MKWYNMRSFCAIIFKSTRSNATAVATIIQHFVVVHSNFSPDFLACFVHLHTTEFPIYSRLAFSLLLLRTSAEHSTNSGGSKSMGEPATLNEQKNSIVLSAQMTSSHFAQCMCILLCVDFKWRTHWEPGSENEIAAPSRKHFSIILLKQQHHLHKYFSGAMLFFFFITSSHTRRASRTEYPMHPFHP